MRKAANQQRRWRAADILRRARFLDDAGPIRLVDIEAVALSRSQKRTLECRSPGTPYRIAYT